MVRHEFGCERLLSLCMCGLVYTPSGSRSRHYAGSWRLCRLSTPADAWRTLRLAGCWSVRDECCPSVKSRSRILETQRYPVSIKPSLKNVDVLMCWCVVSLLDTGFPCIPYFCTPRPPMPWSCMKLLQYNIILHNTTMLMETHYIWILTFENHYKLVNVIIMPFNVSLNWYWYTQTTTYCPYIYPFRQLISLPDNLLSPQGASLRSPKEVIAVMTAVPPVNLAIQESASKSRDVHEMEVCCLQSKCQL